ncbi:uncharacterized protein LOC125779142 [Bactrocera dorsalis]|uniref:Uncharacterized protein LOC125779142 n=1 Tax=Bactrocera dorsalis TaxID=27457 RepID=A0ABM3K2P9_BACDO|nr:uncharacterized protein LOC125779142 [Bactrocera dorsalis]
MLVRNELTVFLLPNFSNADVVTAKLECDTGNIWLVAAYMPHDDEVGPPPALLRRTLEEASRNGADVIIGSDANSRHSIWGSSDTNTRGESLFDFIISEYLCICNRGNSPTFVTAGREEVLDLTLASHRIAPLISNWRVIDDHSFSDHRYIGFSIDGEGPPRKSFRNPRNTDWEGYRRKLRQTLPRAPGVDTLATADVVDGWVEAFSSACITALESSCPLKTPKGRGKPQWWTLELSEIRASCRRLFNKAGRSGLPDDWVLYKTGLSIYKSELRRAKRISWKSFCEKVEGFHESSRFRRILAKNPVSLGYLKDVDGKWALSSEETLQMLLNAHFPSNTSSTEVPL